MPHCNRCALKHHLQGFSRTQAQRRGIIDQTNMHTTEECIHNLRESIQELYERLIPNYNNQLEAAYQSAQFLISRDQLDNAAGRPSWNMGCHIDSSSVGISPPRRCTRPAGHQGSHQAAPDDAGNSWTWPNEDSHTWNRA